MNVLRDNRGNVTIMALFMLMASIVISFIFFDFFKVFMVGQVAQNGADAVAMAASKMMKEIYVERIKNEVAEKLNDIDSYVEKETDRKLDWYIDQAKKDSTIKIPTRDEIRDGVINNLPYHSIIQEIIRNGQVPSDLKLFDIAEHLFSDSEITKYACGSVISKRNEIKEYAKSFVENIDIKEDIKIIFPYENNFAVHVVVKKNVPITMVEADENQFELSSDAAVQISWPDNIQFIPGECH